MPLICGLLGAGEDLQQPAQPWVLLGRTSGAADACLPPALLLASYRCANTHVVTDAPEMAGADGHAPRPCRGLPPRLAPQRGRGTRARRRRRWPTAAAHTAVAAAVAAAAPGWRRAGAGPGGGGGDGVHPGDSPGRATQRRGWGRRRRVGGAGGQGRGWCTVRPPPRCSSSSSSKCPSR